MTNPSRPGELRPLQDFLACGYAPDDWVGLLSRSSTSGHVSQHVRPVAWVLTRRVQSWLATLDRQGWHHYIGVNAFVAGQRSRRRTAVSAVRHVMLDLDHHVGESLAGIAHQGLPQPSYLIHSSAERMHILWRVTGFSREHAEALQRHLARELHTDAAATSCTQLTRLIGSHNHKYHPAPEVTIEFVHARALYTPDDFPAPRRPRRAPAAATPRPQYVRSTDLHRRVRRYLARVEPAVMGQHGDQRTFQVCCRLVRGFALGDSEALALLQDWNARCQPPWHTRDLEAKLQHARRYGREPIGGLLHAVHPANPTNVSQQQASGEMDSGSAPSAVTDHAAARLADAAPTHAPRGRECHSSSPASRQCSERCPTVSALGDTV
jgi:hypothetical protein